MKTITYVTILALFLGGCTFTPLTPLERQVKYEQQIVRCRNTGGVWYEWGNLNGRCNYTTYGL